MLVNDKNIPCTTSTKKRYIKNKQGLVMIPTFDRMYLFRHLRSHITFCVFLNAPPTLEKLSLFLGIQTVRVALDNLGRPIRSILDYISRSKIRRGEMTV